MLMTSVVWNVSWFVLQAAYVPYAMRTLGMSAASVGVTLACQGVGMVLGALLAKRVVATIPFGAAILLGPAFSVASAAVLVLTVFFPLPWLAGLAFFLFGVGPALWVITSTTLRQTVTLDAMQGRATALFLTVNMGARPLGALIGGAVGVAYGESACLILALLGYCLQMGIIFFSKVRGLQALPASVNL
jgi:predicted MFS family arabinose efflux permease